MACVTTHKQPLFLTKREEKEFSLTPPIVMECWPVMCPRQGDFAMAAKRTSGDGEREVQNRGV